MSTEPNNTNPATTAEPVEATSPGAATQGPIHSNPNPTAAPEPQPAQHQAQPAAAMPPNGSLHVSFEDDEPTPGNEAPGHARAVAPSVAETAWDEEELEPGDDIGNRIDGPAHHERSAAVAEAAARKPRNRRKKKGSEAAQHDSAPRPTADGAAPSRRAKKGSPQQSRERPAFRVGEEVFGKVVELSEHAIIIDLSSKARAIFDRHELSPESQPQIGDHFVANIHGDGVRGGMVVLTRSTTRVDAAKAHVEAAAAADQLVEGLITGVIKGGVEVDVDGLRAFAPGSHVDLRLGADLNHLVAQRLPFHVVKYAKNGREVVLSRRKLLEEEATRVRREGLAMLQPGTVVNAIVRSVVDWGVFVAIPCANDIEGLIHVTESSHDRTTRLVDQFQPGQALDVKILRIDEKGKLWLSRKAVGGDPWAQAADKFNVGSRHVGRIARMQPFGAFVELAPGIDGLIRTSDISLRRASHPSEAVSIGDEIEVVVRHLDVSQRKIGLHPALPANPNEAPQKVALHRAVKAEVLSAEPAGLLVRILGVTGGDARGFIPAGHTGTQRGTDLRKEFPAGTILDAKVIDVDDRRGERKLSIRALKEDTEKAAFNEYRAKVARESKFGTFGDLLAAKHRSNS
jgi:small subunit ribosomal protein S1